MENINKKEGLVLEARTFSRFKVSGMGTELDSGGIRSEMIMRSAKPVATWVPTVL